MKKLITKSKQLLFVLAALVMGAGTVWADELTIFESATSTSYEIPIYAYNADTSGDQSEFVVPSSLLSSISGKTITGINFYCASFSWGSKIPQYTVYMKEVESETLTAYAGDTDATTVYTGELSLNGSLMEITFTTPYTYNGGHLLVGTKVSTSGSYVAKNNSTFYGDTSSDVTCSRFSGGGRTFIPKTTFITPTEGPALTVKDGDTKLASPYSYNFGLAAAGATKAFTLSNPGTETTTVSVTHTGSFGAELSATSIPAGESVTLTVTMPDASGNDAITISSTSDAIDDFVINVSGTVRNPNKVYLDFADGTIPDGWTSVAIGSWASSYGTKWTAATGYISQSGSSSNYEWAFTSPKLTFTEGETIFFETAKYGSSSYYNPSIKVEYSTDGNTWNTIGSAYTDDIYGTWTSRSVNIPTANAKYIRFSGWYIHMRNIYGGELPQEPKMVVTQPTSLDFGAISEATNKTFTIANTGLATLSGINVVSSNSDVFAISDAPTSLEAGTSQEVTITMSAEQTGAQSSEITVSATGMEDVSFTVTGAVIPADLPKEEFTDGLPVNWTNSGWTFANGEATAKSTSTMTTPKIVFAEGGILVIKIKNYDSDSSNSIKINGSSDNGSTWSAYSKTISSSNFISKSDWTTLVISDIPSTVNKIQVVGFYCIVDEIAGLYYAPDLSVTLNDEAVASPANYDFGENLTADATVTYSLTNVGAGTLNITNVAITGDGAAAYSTNWTESVAAPFDLVITRTYDGTRTGAQEAVVTVTTDGGNFVVNVTGSDRGLNAPELSIGLASLDFGRLTANDTKTVTVTNAGTGSMTVDIASDNTLFIVSPAQLAEIGEGESKTFDVTFNYAADNYGAKTATITVTPTYEGGEAKTISATAYAKNPNVWSEEFNDADVADRGWTMDSGWSIADGQAVAGGSNYLTTPFLTVTGESDELTFDYEITSNWTVVNYEVWKDGAKLSSATIPSDYSSTYVSLNNGDNGTETITGLTAGTYQFRFKGGNYKLDNFEGFERFIPEHAAEITTVTIPSTGYMGREYTATVTVKEKAGKEEAATADLYIGGTKMATKAATLIANGETEITLTFTPDAAVSYQSANIVVTYAGGDLTSTSSYVTIKEVITFDEAQDNTVTTGSMQAVLLKRSFIQGWNTICLPFGITNPTTIFGSDVKVYTFNSYSADNGLSFSAINLSNGMDAGTPYLAYIPSAVSSELFFENVSISASSSTVTKGDVTFQGTYSPIAAGSLTDNYVLTNAGANAKIAKATEKASMKAFRAYFTAPAEARMTISFDDNTTGIGAITTDGELEVGTLYNLKGQKVQGTQKGLYILNGKKVVVK